MIRIHKNQVDVLCIQIPGQVESVVPGGLTAHNNLLGGCHVLITSQILQKALGALQNIAEPIYLLGQFLPTPVERSGEVCLAADVHTHN